MLNQKGNLHILLGFILSLITVGVGAYYLGSQQQPIPINEQPAPSPESANLDASKDETTMCNKNECLFKNDNNHIGYAVLEGYYKQYDGTKWEWANKKATCDSLLTTGGSEKLINEFRDSAKSGNTLNKFIDDNFLINIDLSNLSVSDKALIKNSSASNPINLGVIRKLEGGGGVPTCYSLVDIVSVKPLNN